MAPVKGTAQEIKEELLWVAKESLRTNLVHGTAGNFSARLPDGNVVLTPSSLPYETMTLDDLVVTDLDGNVLEGTNGPTTEKMLHLACLKAYDDIHAVIHCHAKFCTMFALTNQPIPCAIEEVEVFVGGDVPVANYQFTGLAGARRRGVEVGRRPRRGVDGEPRPPDRRQVAEGRVEDREPRRAHRRDHLGRAAARRDRAAPRLHPREDGPVLQDAPRDVARYASLSSPGAA